MLRLIPRSCARHLSPTVAIMKQIVMLPPTASADRHKRMMFDITRLPEDQRLVLSLFFHEDLSLDEIATVLERAEDQVAASFYWAHANLGLCPMPPLAAAVA